MRQDMFQKDHFEADFHKERRKKGESFHNQDEILRDIITNAYYSFNVNKSLEEAKLSIYKITEEQLNSDLKAYYKVAKTIGDYIENFFIDKNYSKESSMASLCDINIKIGGSYGKLKPLIAKDPLFRNLCKIYESIQMPTQDTTAATHLHKPKNSSDTRSVKSNESNKTEMLGNPSRRQSIVSTLDSANSQILDLQTLQHGSQTNLDKID
jgi:hypothetical protein